MYNRLLFVIITTILVYCYCCKGGKSSRKSQKEYYGKYQHYDDRYNIPRKPQKPTYSKNKTSNGATIIPIPGGLPMVGSDLDKNKGNS
eukprot:Pgem_evm1s16917